MSKPKSTPNFKEFVGIEQQGLRARLDAVRAAISHAGEKGRALEADVQKLIRSFLPAEYGLSTGFIVSRTPDGNVEISKQLDIIIYDALRAAPLMTIGTSDVFPIEAVYAYRTTPSFASFASASIGRQKAVVLQQSGSSAYTVWLSDPILSLSKVSRIFGPWTSSHSVWPMSARKSIRTCTVSLLPT